MFHFESSESLAKKAAAFMARVKEEKLRNAQAISSTPTTSEPTPTRIVGVQYNGPNSLCTVWRAGREKEPSQEPWAALDIQPEDRIRAVKRRNKRVAVVQLAKKVPFVRPHLRREVVAIQRSGGKTRKQKMAKVWWAGQDKPTVEPWSHLDGIDVEKLIEAEERPGKRVKLTGARHAADPHHTRGETVVPAGALSPPVPPSNLECGESVVFQAEGGFCALNAVANGVKLSSDLYDSIHAMGPFTTLEEIVMVLTSAKGRPISAEKVSIPNSHLLPHLLSLTAGTFAVEFDGHCATWDAERQLILDTDPRFPTAVPINEGALQLLKIERIEKAYAIGVRQEKKRKRG